MTMKLKNTEVNDDRCSSRLFFDCWIFE